MQAIENLRLQAFETIRADVPELLEWMQDMNWPVGSGICEYLSPHVNKIKEDLLNILNSSDDLWKLWIISSLIANSQIRHKIKLDRELILKIKSIADRPTAGETEQGVDIAAKELISDYKW